MLKNRLISFLILLVFILPVFAGETHSTDRESFAKEYATLKALLQKVRSKDSAKLYKPQIEQELDRLRSSQISGSEEFTSLSKNEKKEFIKKFQNNQFHCGEVTQVMEERRRILLNPELNEILGSLVQKIP
jgi:hypothetical protein